MHETHPFGDFNPRNARYLVLGSFTTKEAFDPKKKAMYKWFYANGGRNQFWPILEEIYKTNLKTRQDMQNLFTKLNIALADIIYECNRVKHSNLDMHLKNIVINPNLASLILDSKIEKIFFTSKYVENLFRRHFKSLISQRPNIELITLPSPSPRYALLTKEEKTKRYKELLPKFI